MPKDNRGTLAAFDDLLASLEEMAEEDLAGSDNHEPIQLTVLPDPEPSPSAIDNEFYDFYFEINNVPRKASNASSTTPSAASKPQVNNMTPSHSSQIPQYSSHTSPPPPHIDMTPSSRPPSALHTQQHQFTPPAPPVPPAAPKPPPPAPKRATPPQAPAVKPTAPNSKPKIGAKSPPMKPHSKHAPNKSNLSLKPIAKTPALISPPSAAAAPPYEAPQRFLSRGSYNSGASQVDAPSPPPPKEIPQRFLSTGSYITQPPPASSSPAQPFFSPKPSFNQPSEPPQRFFSTNTFTSRPQPTPSSPTSKDAPQRFFSTNNAQPRKRSSYIGNRQSQNTAQSPQQTPQSFTPQPAQQRNPPSQSYNPQPQPYNPPTSFHPPPPQAHNPPPQQYQPPPSSQFSPPSSLSSSSEWDRKNKLSSVNARKSVRMPQNTSALAAKNFCGKCGSPVTGEHVMALNQFWCLDHFNCTDCYRPLHGAFSEENGSPYCTDCMANKHLCITCGKGVTSGQFYITDQGRRHAECMPTVLCDMCNQPIRAGTSKMKAMDKTFHPECFRCVTCHKLIQGEFTNRSGRPNCMQCAQATQPKCAKCFNPITGQYVNYSSKRYHHECFSCDKCNTRLSLEGFYTNADSIYCERCINTL